MKELLVIGATLAASQCLSEPSGDPDSKSSPPASTTAKASDAGQAATPDAGTPDADTADAGTAGAWLQLGPPPFGVPTKRIPLGEYAATILVPAGAKAEPTASGLRIKLGEGKNFSMWVGNSESELADVRPLLNSELDELEPREDGALVWESEGHSFFQLPGTYVCWNDDAHPHDADDIEVMIASCASIEADAP